MQQLSILFSSSFTASPSTSTATTSSTTITASSEVSQTTAISDRPKAKPVSKKEGKNARKTAAAAAAGGMSLAAATPLSLGIAEAGQMQRQIGYILEGMKLQQEVMEAEQKQRNANHQIHQVCRHILTLNQPLIKNVNCGQLSRSCYFHKKKKIFFLLKKILLFSIEQVQQLQQLNQQLQMQLEQSQPQQQGQQPPTMTQQQLSLPSEQVEPDLARLHRDGSCPFFTAAQKGKVSAPGFVSEQGLKLEDGTHIPIDDAIDIFRSISFDDIPSGKSKFQLFILSGVILLSKILIHFFVSLTALEESEKLDLKKMDIASNKEQEQQVGTAATPTTATATTQRDNQQPPESYFALPVPSASTAAASLPSVHALQVRTKKKSKKKSQLLRILNS